MTRYAADCNGDGNIDCKDYKHIRQKGFGNCKSRKIVSRIQEEEIKEEDKEYDLDIRVVFDD
jgi:Destabilase